MELALISQCMYICFGTVLIFFSFLFFFKFVFKKLQSENSRRRLHIHRVKMAKVPTPRTQHGALAVEETRLFTPEYLLSLGLQIG